MPSEISQVSVDLGAVRFWTWAIACALALAIVSATRRPAGSRFGATRAGIVGAVAILLLAWTWPHGLGRVQPGARGVVLRFGAPTGRIASEGLYYVVPFAERVVEVNT